jgi:hypothetical protein
VGSDESHAHGTPKAQVVYAAGLKSWCEHNLCLRLTQNVWVYIVLVINEGETRETEIHTITRGRERAKNR